MSTGDLYVATTGDDANPGSEAAPLRTIARAAELLGPGRTCYVAPGRYRESVRVTRSGSEAAPIRFIAASGAGVDEPVIIDGTDPVPGPWERYRGSIYRARVEGSFQQLFSDGKMMIEARWPNISFRDVLSRDGWRGTGAGSRYGRIVDPALAGAPVDWSGGIAVLNVAHQFYSWSRRVESFDAAQGVITYPKDLPSITHFADKTEPWEHNRYYLSGRLGALDAPGEWYLDDETGWLYLWTLEGDDPTDHEISAKRRDYGFAGNGTGHLTIEGFELVGCTIRFEECDHVVIDRCHLLFPLAAREIPDPNRGVGEGACTLLSGEHHVFRNSSIAFSPTHGLVVLGSHHLIENNLIHSISWNGSLAFNAIRCGARPGHEEREEGHTVIRRNTAFDCGNSIVSACDAPHYTVELNHLHDGGLVSKDVSLLYTHLPLVEPTVFRRNWVHDCHSEHLAIGIRGDDQTRGLTVDHNVVWGCDWFGIIVKGDRDRVHHNTVLGSGKYDILMRRRAEPEKPWRRQWPLLDEQHRNSECHNNVARIISSTHEGIEPLNCPNEGNYPGDAPMLADRAAFDFRPAPGSPLIDRGVAIAGMNDGFRGAAPDIGAYEYGGERWVPGVDWPADEIEKRRYRDLVW